MKVRAAYLIVRVSLLLLLIKSKPVVFTLWHMSEPPRPMAGEVR